MLRSLRRPSRLLIVCGRELGHVLCQVRKGCTQFIPGAADDKVISDHVATGQVEAWRITFPNGATLDFSGFATKHSRATPMADKMTGSATFKVSGKPLMTPAA